MLTRPLGAAGFRAAGSRRPASAGAAEAAPGAALLPARSALLSPGRSLRSSAPACAPADTCQASHSSPCESAACQVPHNTAHQSSLGQKIMHERLTPSPSGSPAATPGPPGIGQPGLCQLKRPLPPATMACCGSVLSQHCFRLPFRWLAQSQLAMVVCQQDGEAVPKL